MRLEMNEAEPTTEIESNENKTKRVELVGTGSKKNCSVVKNGMTQLCIDEIPESDAN